MSSAMMRTMLGLSSMTFSFSVHDHRKEKTGSNTTGKARKQLSTLFNVGLVGGLYLQTDQFLGPYGRKRSDGLKPSDR